MEAEHIQGELKTFIVEQYLFGKDVALDDHDSFMEHGLLDSTGILELVAFVENTYGLRLEDDELLPENLDSIAAVTAFVVRKRAALLCEDGAIRA
jgi:acyl carrier protein